MRAPSGDVRTRSQIAHWGYNAPRDLTKATAQHATFVEALSADGADVLVAPALPEQADATYTCDPGLPVPGGVILLNMGRTLRAEEPNALAETLRLAETPILGRLDGAAHAEGGDCLWLDDRTLLVGDGYRTDPEGIAQLAVLLPDVDVVTIQLPHHRGPGSCLHLQSLVSMLDCDLAVVHEHLAPVALLRMLRARGVQMLRLPAEEFETLGSNIICTAPRRVIMAAGNPRTAAMLGNHRVRVTEIDAPDLMWAGQGGPTCLVLPLERSE